jgi:hypothetical protein
MFLVLVVASSSCGAFRRPHVAGRHDRWRSLATPHVRLLADLTRREAEEAAWALEDFHRALAAAFFHCARPVDRVVVDVTMFSDWDTYESVAPNGAFGLMRDGTNALATIPPHVVLPASPGIARGSVMQTYVHELTHRFVHVCLPSAPVWLDEGLAMYFETLRVHDGRIVVGEPPYLLGGEGPMHGVRRDGSRVTRFDGVLPSAHELVGFSGPAFYRWDEPFASREPHYVAAWALAHLLMTSGDPDVHARFVRYLEALVSGATDADEAWHAAFDGIDVDASLATYVRSGILARVDVPYAAPFIAHPFVRDLDASELELRMAELLRDHDPASALVHARAAGESRVDAAHAALIEAMTDAPAAFDAHFLRAMSLGGDEREVLRARVVRALSRSDAAETATLRERYRRMQTPGAMDLVRWSEIEMASANEQRAVELAERAVGLTPEEWEARAALGLALVRSHHGALGRARLVSAANAASEHARDAARRIEHLLSTFDAHRRVAPAGAMPAVDASIPIASPDAPIAIAGTIGTASMRRLSAAAASASRRARRSFACGCPQASRG